MALQPHKQEVISASWLHLRVNFILAILWWKELTILEEKEKEAAFLRFFWNNCTDLETVIPWGSCVSAINTLWASSAGLSGLGLIYRCCIWLSQETYFLFSVEQWWVKMTKGESEISLMTSFLHCYPVCLGEPPAVPELTARGQLASWGKVFVCRESRRWNNSYVPFSFYVDGFK